MSYPNTSNITYLPPDYRELENGGCIHDEEMMYPFWQAQAGNSFTVSNILYKIIFPGIRNPYSGPDFKNAVLSTVDGEQIFGDVEIHTNTLHWKHHGHRNDPKYANVILHVILDGDTNSVKQTDLNVIPTVKLMDHLSMPVSPCNSVTNWIDQDEIFSAIEIFAKLRWDQLKLRMTDRSDNEMAFILFRSLAFNCNNQQIQKVHKMFMSLYLDKKNTMQSIITHMCHLEKSIQWDMGSKYPSSHPAYRMAIVTWLAFTLLDNPSSLSFSSLIDLKQVTTELRKSGYMVPGISFLHELMGNIILPFVSVTTEKTLFKTWYNNPVQMYSIVKNRFKVWGISSSPITFGIQQGMLYLEKTLCSGNLCHHCSLLRWSESRCFTT